MYDSFGFDPKTFSNDDLFNKQMELTHRRVLAARTGRADILAQIDAMIRAIENERRERMFLDRFGPAMTASVVIETDPSLRQKAEIEDEAQEAATKKADNARPVRRVVRTNKPVTPTEGDA